MLHTNVKIRGFNYTNIYVLKNLFVLAKVSKKTKFAFTTAVTEVLSVFYFKVNKSKYRKQGQKNIQCINWVVLLNGNLFGYA